MELAQKIAIARGHEPADLLLTNLQLINVHTGEIYPTEIAIAGSRIVGVGEGYAAKKTLDLGGRYVSPGLIDAHVHIESSLCTPPEFAKAVLARGITTVITDPHEIANVLGLEGIRFMLNAAKYNPLSMFVMASSCVPATHMETSGAALEAEDLEGLLNNQWVLGLAEMMNYPGVIFADSRVLQKIEMFEQKVVDGHCPGVTGKNLNAYRVAGIRSDHECTTVEEALEKLRAGMVIFIREATNAHNLETLLPLVTPENSRRICFCTDDRQPADLIDQGSIDYMVRVAIQHGVRPIDALRMATLNTAEYFRLHNSGAVAPGYFADLMVFSNLTAPMAEMVFRSGELVVENGQLMTTFNDSLSTMRSSINIQWGGLSFDIPAENGARIRVIGSVENQLVTHHLIEDAKVTNGLAVADLERDILKMAVIERHTASGNVGKGFIQGIGLKRGAIAGTVAHDHHNLVVIGTDDNSMKHAVQAVARMDGGLVAVDGENVLASLPLPIAGLMSDKPVHEVRDGMENLLKAAAELGSTMHDPFMAMSFMALEVIPNLKLTDIGLVDVEKFTPVSLFV
ncbi:MAG: adenine deaminase [Anaerolineae bacterium]|nr:adenine deaminase [Anaerolineae bacterium]